MKEVKIETTLQVYDSISNLPEDVQQLMNSAIEARKHAYSPYSKFDVGAAILLDNGKVIKGTNQENSAYPSGLCAERVAIFYAGSQYPEATIHSMAISAKSLHSKITKAVPPCGACRQVLAEYEVKQNSLIEIYFMGESGKVVKSNSVKDILPLIFDNTFL